MRILRQIAFYLIILLSVLVILASLLSLVHDLSYWYSKILDFPRLQYLLLAVICLLLYLLLNKEWKIPSILLLLGLVASIGINSAKILPYLIGEKTVPDALVNATPENSAGILVANVLITNKKATGFLQIVENQDPDMVLVLEVDRWWIDQLGPLKQRYPYAMELPLDNAYGMALYSKFPLKDRDIKFLQHNNVPSFHTKVQLPSGKTFRFHGVHPVPPTRSSKYPDNVGLEEVELARIGGMVATDSIPSVVAGDFNDVSWSYTSRLFEQEGNLKNVRIGRGIFSTYNAKSPILRWPLDHFFVTKEFSLVELQRLPKFGSDHFPIFAELVLD